MTTELQMPGSAQAMRATAVDKNAYDTTCDASRTTVRSEVTFGADWYTAVVRGQSNGASSMSTVSAKQVSPTCTGAN